MSKERFILILDSGTNFSANLKDDPLFNTYPFVHVTNGEEAQNLLYQKKLNFSGIFISPTVNSKPNWVSVVKCALLNYRFLPIFLIQEEGESKRLQEIDLRNLGIQSVVSREITYPEIIKLVSPVLVNFEMKKSLSSTRIDSLESDGYIGISAINFISGSKSLFDIYVRLSRGRYIKILHAEDSFDASRVESYLNKGVEYFYIERNAHEAYVQYCDKIAKVIITNEGVSQDVKTIQTMNHGEEILKHFQNFGITRQNIEYAQDFARNVNAYAKQIGQKTESKMVQTFLQHSMAYEHGVGISMLAGLMSQHFNISSDSSFQVVALSALFHDMALSVENVKFLEDNYTTFNEEELVIYRNHPQKAAKELLRVPGIPPGALQAIEQHHMRVKGKGFPVREPGAMVTLVAEIIGLCDELTRAHILSVTKSNFDLLGHFETEVFPYFSFSGVRAFKKTFLPDMFKIAGE
jgi:HD-GYP domain-containing protein (c-di-GMP phosphodiesterase class II)